MRCLLYPLIFCTATWRCILATDMSRHNEIVNQFTNVVLNDLDIAWEIDEETGLPLWAVDKTKRDLVMMILIKVCDISNEARPLTVATQWIDRLLAEFFYQVTDKIPSITIHHCESYSICCIKFWRYRVTVIVDVWLHCCDRSQIEKSSEI